MIAFERTKAEQKPKKTINFDVSINRGMTLCGEIVGDLYIEFNGRKGDDSSPKRVSFKFHAPVYFQTDRGSFKREEFHTVEVHGPLCFQFLDQEKFKQGQTVWLKGTHIFEEIIDSNDQASHTYSNLILENQDDAVSFLDQFPGVRH